ncbi:hypothetical protein JDV02_010856 [Purpureocillium takamizusanense]|uniref:Uncharacterized protein n=1 Tax=Purpureocillium takamizusanense TaxID=2060973 RepID=A0A9Q8VB57_9HYPO|nr:uncharacterized protein JDV02_010856 [Purpureocillium takamizusanense]UNI19353.1 hypothetical protein JDV02_010856 [Purpureocillium takamizusanense]
MRGGMGWEGGRIADGNKAQSTVYNTTPHSGVHIGELGNARQRRCARGTRWHQQDGLHMRERCGAWWQTGRRRRSLVCACARQWMVLLYYDASGLARARRALQQ